MSATHTYHTLNDDRPFGDAIYESGSHSKLVSGALVVAIFLGVGTYFYTSTPPHSTETTPASGAMNYEAPVAPDSVAPADSMESHPDVPDSALLAPATNTVTPDAPIQDSTMNRAPAATRSTAAPAQSAQRAKQSSQPLTRPSSDSTPVAAGNVATAVPDMSTPGQIVEPQPAPEEPMATQSEIPADVAPDAAIP